MSRLRRLRPIHQAADPTGTAVSAWSAPIGFWAGRPVRIHVSLAVTLVLAAGACIHNESPVLALAIAVYIASLLGHEAAHVAAASYTKRGRLGVSHDAIVLGPIGGMRVPGSSVDPRERVFVAMAGPVANLALVVFGMCCLVGNETEPFGKLLIDPYAALGDAAEGQTPLSTLAPLLVAINWPLFALNLAPSTPFDGGVALRSWLAIWVGVRPARDSSCFVALLVAAGLLGAGGALVLARVADPLTGAGFAALALVIAFGARADAFAPAFDLGWGSDTAGYSLAELRPPTAEGGATRLVVATTREATLGDETLHGDEPDRNEDRWDESRVDAILAKVHANGMHELTANERAILERASERYQRRRSDG